MKKICIVTPSYPAFPEKGDFLKDMNDWLAKDGYKISVVTPRISQEKEYEEWDFEKVYRFKFWSEKKLLVTYKKIPILRMITYIISGIITTCRVVKKENAQFIHAHWVIPAGLIGMITSKLLNRPFTVSAHGSDVAKALDNSFLRILFKLIIRNTCLIHSVANHLTKSIISMGGKQERIITFPMSIDERTFNPFASKLELGKYVVFSNRALYPRYNVDLLIKAIPFVLDTLPDVRFIIAGIGEEQGKLEKLTRVLGVQESTKFIGMITHSEMPKYLGLSTVFVSTSLAEGEGACVSLLEAMACGTFPVVTDMPANREWVKNGQNGFLFPVNNERILAEQIIKAIKNETIREKAKAMNIEIIRKRALWSNNISKIEKHYEKFLR